MTALKNLSPGASFTYAGEKFVVLEHMDDGVFCILEQSKKSVPFNGSDKNPMNDYRGSNLEKEIAAWLDGLRGNGAKAGDMVKFDVELTDGDRSHSYGTISAYAAPLTLWQYGKYKELMPLNEDDWWWLVTPWACPWLRSPGCSSSNGSKYAFFVYTDGDCYNSSCSSSYGIRPALKLNSLLLVSSDGEEKADEGCDFCENFDFGMASAKVEDMRANIYFCGGSRRYQKEEQFRFCPVCGKKLFAEDDTEE